MSVLASTIGLIFVKETTSYASGLPGVFLQETALISGVGRMDGAASVAAAGSTLLPGSIGAAEMDGQAAMAAATIARSSLIATMNGQAAMAATGITFVKAAAQMDGVGALVAPFPLGATVAEMDGASDVEFIGAFTGPNIYSMSLMDGVAAFQGNPIPHVKYHFSLIQGFLNRSTVLASFRFKRALTQNVQLADSRALRIAQKLRDALALSLSQSTHTRYAYVFTSLISMRPESAPLWSRFISLAQNVNLSQATAAKFIWGRLLKETLKISSAGSGIGIYKKSLTQLFNFAQTFKARRSITLSQTINIHASSFLGFGMKLLQNLLAASQSSPKLNYHLKLIAEVIIQDIIGHYHFADMLLAELLTIEPALSRQYIASASFAQLLTISPHFTNKLILKIVGNIQLSPSQLVEMIYKGDPLLDGVVIQALYISPSGTATTWAVNTRTAAVTEYLNYDFNSFAQMGNRYVAAGADGLYELTGDTDDGALIISRMMSGYLQLNEKKLFGIKGAYVAIRGGGRFYLKLIAGDGREYVYELKAQPNLMATKIKVGKGISTTYMAFELVTEGQDFDLDSIEFIPMTRGRRV